MNGRERMRCEQMGFMLKQTLSHKYTLMKVDGQDEEQQFSKVNTGNPGLPF